MGRISIRFMSETNIELVGVLLPSREDPNSKREKRFDHESEGWYVICAEIAKIKKLKINTKRIVGALVTGFNMRIRYRTRPWIVSRDKEVTSLYFGSSGLNPMSPKQIAIQLSISIRSVYRSIERFSTWKSTLIKVSKSVEK